MGPLPETSAGNRYILVKVNHFTKWDTACPIRRADAITVAHGLMGETDFYGSLKFRSMLEKGTPNVVYLWKLN